MDSEVFNPTVYNNAYRLVKTFILQNSGTYHDVEDIIQDGFLLFFEKLSDKNFTLYVKPEHYIYKVCQKKWLKVLAYRKMYKTVTVIDIEEEPVVDRTILIKQRKEQLITIIEKNIKKLGLSCQKLLEYKRQGLTCDQIAELLGLCNRQAVKDRI